MRASRGSVRQRTEPMGASIAHTVRYTKLAPDRFGGTSCGALAVSYSEIDRAVDG
jgi:hypothetical protein